MSDQDMMLIPSRLFGPLRVSSDRLFAFPDGLLGFAGERRFVFLPTKANGVFWLQSADEGNLAFLVVDPFLFFPDYAVEVPEDGSLPFDAYAHEDLLVLAIVTLPVDDRARPTANLDAPVILQLAERRGCQHITEGSRFTSREPFDLPVPTT